MELGFPVDSGEELLDEDGEPFFQPIDWDVVIEKSRRGERIDVDDAELDAIVIDSYGSQLTAS